MRAAIYARYSAGPRQTDVSIEGQEKVCRNYIQAKCYDFIGMYADRHISGRTDKRPEFQRMIDEAKAGAFDVLVVYSLDRFSRDKYDSAIYKKVLRDSGITVESASENIPEGPEGIMFEGILESLAVYYSAELSKKIKRGMRVKAEKAKSTGGPTPFGYHLENGEYKISDREAAAVKEVYDMYLAGSSMAEAARYLNDLGFLTSAKKPFSSNTLRKILSNKKYIGYYIYDGVEIEGGMPKIIDEDVFYMTQEKLNQNARHKPKGEFALTGKLICGSCGEFMRGTSGTSHTGTAHYYYRCPSKDRKNIPRDKLEHLVAQHVREVLSGPSELSYIVDKLFTIQLEENASELEYNALDDNLKAIERKIDNAVDHILEHGSNQALAAKLEELEAERSRLRRRLQELKIGKQLSKDEIREALQATLLNPDMNDADVIRVFVHQVILYSDRLLIEFNLQDQEGLKTEELLGFDQNELCSTKEAIGRTLHILRGRVVAIIKNEA